VIEDLGIMLPVVELNVKYLRPARYDDLLTITTQLRDFPIDHRITFHQEIHNEEGKLLTIGTVKLYFMDKNLGNRAAMPPFLAEKLSSYFS
jgi:acyl-CoA thioester hydrolase